MQRPNGPITVDLIIAEDDDLVEVPGQIEGEGAHDVKPRHEGEAVPPPTAASPF